MALDYAYWRHLVGCTVLPKGDDYPEFFHRVALICVEAEQAGNQCGVWHAVSIAEGTLDRCVCRPCVMAREVAASMTDANAEVARLAKRISAKSALAMSDGKYHTLRADYALALRRQRDEQEKMRGGTVSMAEDKNLWGKHVVTGRWTRLQGPCDVDTLSQYQRHFTRETVAEAYAHVPYSGFTRDTRPVYSAFRISKRAPSVKR